MPRLSAVARLLACSGTILLAWDLFAARPSGSASQPSAPARESAEPRNGPPSSRQRAAVRGDAKSTAGVREALDKASRLDPPEKALEAMEQICRMKAERDPALAVELACEYGLAGGSVHFLENLVHCWAEADLAAAMHWFRASPPEGPAKTACASRLAFVLARSSGADAARFALEEIPAGEAQDEAIVSVLHQWLQREPAAATAWVGSFPDGPLKLRAEAELKGLLEASR